jgi:hypothetical protein
VLMPVPNNTLFPKGYAPQGSVPKGLVVTNGWVSLARDPTTATKIGNDAGALVWVGTNQVLLAESPRQPGLPKTSFPDGGASAEVYTNPNPVPYVELELLGPLSQLGTNNTVSATSVYTLFRRSQPTPLGEAEKILER